MAEATLTTSKMIVGEVENLSALGLSPEEGSEDFSKKLRAMVDGCPVKRVLIIADIMGGTPFNTAFRLSAEGLCEALIPGLSLPLIVQLETVYQDAEDLSFIADVLGETKKCMVNVLDQQQNSSNEEDE